MKLTIDIECHTGHAEQLIRSIMNDIRASIEEKRFLYDVSIKPEDFTATVTVVEADKPENNT